jgi:HSP20 family protein
MGPNDRDRDDREPFDDIFRELNRVMNDVMGEDGDSGFGDAVHVTTYREDDTVRVVADLPGVTKESIDVKCDGKTVTIAAATDRREFEERFSLPVQVDEHSATATFNNGVLEITFDRADRSADIDLR